MNKSERRKFNAGRLVSSIMAEEESSLGKILMQVGGIIFIIPLWTGYSDFLWPLFILGPLVFLFGLFLRMSETGDSLTRTTAVALTPHLPTSKGVKFLETVVNWADNPDTATIPVGAQPAGTHPTMGGVYENEFSSQMVSGDFTRTPAAQDYQRESYAQFETHSHEKVVPRDWNDPVSGWYNVHEEWQNPADYW